VVCDKNPAVYFFLAAMTIYIYELRFIFEENRYSQLLHRSI